MTENVVVTGMGVISALGVGTEPTLRALLNGTSGIAPVSMLPTEHRELPVGEVKLTNAQMATEMGVGYPDAELRTVLMGQIALKEALVSAALQQDDLSRCAFISGTTVGGMDLTERHFQNAFESEGDSAETLNLKYNDCGYSSDLIADRFGRFAMVTTTSTACSSAANAIILGANMIKAGVVDIVVAGGAEALTKFHLNGFNALMILDSERCRPFDRDRAGINLGEGAAYVVLESERSAKSRNAVPLARLSGFANTCDAFHQTASSDNGEGAYRSMCKAMQMAGLAPEDIDYINAHGTGTPNNDITELAAMQRIWGKTLPPFSSTKPFTGHTTSASGAIESVISILALNHHFLPPNLGWQNAISEGATPIVALKTGIKLRHVINNSFGFGGNDSTLIFSYPSNPTKATRHE